MRARVVLLALALLSPPALSRAEVVINEIMHHPASELTAEEFIELHNNGTVPVRLAGWRFTSGVSFTFPDVTLAAGGFLVIAADRAALVAKHPGVTNVVGDWTGVLSNSSETIVLKDNLGATVDSVTFADAGDWAVRQRDDPDDGHRGWRWHSGADGGGRSLELINAAFDNGLGQNWAASSAADGTPGRANSVAATDIAPAITHVRHAPLVPTSVQAVTVNATVVDDRGASVSVSVSYRRDGAATWTTAPMFDDGAHDDARAGDGIFGAQLPAAPEGTVVEFHVAASDGTHARTWPAPALNNAAPGQPFMPEQSQNCLYQVDNRTDAGALPLYRIVLKAADRAELAAINQGDGGTSHARFNATFITADGTGAELRYAAGVRNRGHYSATLDPQSFNVTLPDDRPWKGRVALNLNSQYTPLQLLGSALLRRAGLVAAESRAIQLRVNNADPTAGRAGAPSFGFYVCNEVLDSDFADYHFPTDGGGNLYSVRRTDTGPYQEGDLSYLPPAGRHGGDPYRPVYRKTTRESEDDWSDLIALTQALARGRATSLQATPEWDADFVAGVRARVDVEQWMTWFAAQALIGNGESNLGNGFGDDYYLYFGTADRRARLLPYDLDSILGDGDDPFSPDIGIFRMLRHRAEDFPPLTPTPLYPFFRHPDFGPRYFARLQQLLDGALSVASVDFVADHVLHGVVDAAVIRSLKAWYAARHAFVRGLVDVRLAVTEGPAQDAASGLPRTTTATCALAGRADPARTRAVTVNGAAADYAPWRVATTDAETNSFTVAIGEWSIAGIALQPGVNRVLIQAFDAAGLELERTAYEVWYDDGGVAAVSGAITTDTTWTAAAGPHLVAAPLTVNSGVTLTIEPGASVYLGAGAGITVAGGGRILAEGTELRPVHFTREPRSPGRGGTIVIRGAPGVAESRFRHVYFNHGGDPAVICEANANVVLDYCEWQRTDVAYLELNGASFLVSNCIFPSASPGAYFEAVHGLGATPPGGRAIIRDCFFGKCHSTPGNYNDVIDFTGANRPGALLELYRNVFVGSDDDLVDIDGTDAWIEGNLFMHVHRAGSPDSASAVSGGSENGHTSEITIVGNLFYDVDQAATAKQGNFFTFLNNTVVDQNSRGSDERREDIVARPGAFLPAVLNLGDEGSPHAAGLYAEGNVIHSAERLVRNFTGAETVTFHHNLLPPGLSWSGPGAGNVSAAAFLADVSVNAVTGESNIPTPTKDNYRVVAAQIRRQFALDPRSPARGAGPNGADLGGVRPPGVSLAGAPSGTTAATSATLTVGTRLSGSGIPAGAAQFPGGSGWTHYKWRLDGGAWSADVPLGTPLTLSGLAAGSHMVEVAGRNDAGTYQDSGDLGAGALPARATWTVDPAHVPPVAAASVRINEVLASNSQTRGFGGVFPDLIELANVGDAAVDLGGWGLTDNASLPYKYTFPAGTTLAPGALLVVHASSSGAVPAPRTGFALGASGDDLTLTRSAAAGGGIADRVAWGPQFADYSIGRCADGSWALCQPTFGAVNLPAAQSPASGVRINEWLADAAARFSGDFIELHNPGRLPVDIGGFFLTDSPAGWPNRSALPPLTIVPPGGFLVFHADGDASEGPDHVDFKLSPVQGEIAFVSPALVVLDHVIYGPQRTDVSQGRVPDGGALLASFSIPSPAVSNTPGRDSDGDGLPDDWERLHGFDPNNPADAALDADGDGSSNLAEFLAGTNPRNPADGGLAPAQASARAGRIVNLAILAPLSAGETITLGVVVGGAGTAGAKPLVVRAAGPALAQFGVASPLPDPALVLSHQPSGAMVAANNDWAGEPALLAVFARVGAFPFGAANSKDAGLFQPMLAAGGYVVQVGDSGAGAGNVITELYDATPAAEFTVATPRLVNVSVLKRIGMGETLAAGFVIGGTATRTVLVRAIGPSLGAAPFNLAGVSDPRLELYHNATGAKLDENDNWGGTAALNAAFAAVAAFPLADANSRDAALLFSAPPGQYSARVGDITGGGGFLIVELYEMP